MRDKNKDNIVEFNPSDFTLRYPEFRDLPEGTLSNAFDEASMFINNAPTSPIPYKPRVGILNLATAHMLALDARGGGSVGRIAQASQGDVSVSTDGMGSISPSAIFWEQSQYGVKVWQLTKPYRQFIYVPGRK